MTEHPSLKLSGSGDGGRTRLRSLPEHSTLTGTVTRVSAFFSHPVPSARAAPPCAPLHRPQSRHLAEFWMIEPEIAFATLEARRLRPPPGPSKALSGWHTPLLSLPARRGGRRAQHGHPCLKRRESCGSRSISLADLFLGFRV